MRQNIKSGSKWEDIVAYSRAVRVGNIIEVAGTTASDGERVVGKDVYEQAIFIFQKIGNALEKPGGSLKDVVRTRMFVTNISKWEDVARAHRETFEGIEPVTTLVEVSKLIDPEMLIEIEATAIIDEK